MLVDLVATDYLGWGDEGVSGLHRHRERPRPDTPDDAGAPGAAGAEAEALLGQLPPARAAAAARRAFALQCWLDDGEHVPSVISVWPTADWHEREQYDLMGIVFDGHPNLERLLMQDDWEGHPLRKDYPIGGEPVRFSDAE